MKQNNVVPFPLVPIDLDRVRLESDGPCIIVVLPVVMVERLEPAADWVKRLLDSASILSSSDRNK